jgi:DNA-binding transcriptional regulator YiaG
MANVAKVLKDEISRISRKEVKATAGGIGKSQKAIRKVVADLRKKVASLEKEIKRLSAGKPKEKAVPVKEQPAEMEKARLTGKGVRSLRTRLGLSQTQFARLAGVAEQSVYLWEKKEGPLKLRDKTKADLLSIKGLGAREAKAKLDEVGEKPRRRRKAAS